MKVLLSWLREFSPIEGPPEGIAEDLSDLGLAVEDMVTFASTPDGIVVARVAGLRSHPDADRIQLVDVDAGDGEMLQVCCGAFNMSVGDLVPLATVGTTMPGGLEIRRRKMRGQLSEGMLCSTAELDMGADADGIMILPADLEVGGDLTAALGVAGDVLFDLEVNPNRPDALSVVGVARDLAARRGAPFELPELRVETSGPPARRPRWRSSPVTCAGASACACCATPPERGHRRAWLGACWRSACARSTSSWTSPTT